MRQIFLVLGILAGALSVVAKAENHRAVLADRTAAPAARRAAVAALVQEDRVAAATALLEALAAEPAESVQVARRDPIADLALQYFDTVLTVAPATLGTTEMFSLVARVVTSPCFSRHVGSQLLDRLLPESTSLFAGAGYFATGRRDEVSADEYMRRKMRLFLTALRELPLARLGVYINSSQVFGINWDFGSAPVLAYGTQHAATFEAVTEIFRELLGGASFRTRPVDDTAAYYFDSAQSGLGEGLVSFAREARLDTFGASPAWALLVNAAEDAIAEELAKPVGTQVALHRLRGSLVLVARAAPIRAMAAWEAYHRRYFHENRDEYGRALALVSRTAPSFFARWVQRLLASGTSEVATGIVATIFSAQGDATSPGWRMITGVLQAQSERAAASGVRIIVATPDAPPAVNVSAGVAAAAIEGATVMARMFLAERRQNRTQAATFQRVPERTGQWFPVGPDQYFALALLEALSPETARDIERRYREHYRLTAVDEATWENPGLASRALLAEARSLDVLYRAANYDTQRTEEYQRIQETVAALQFRGRLAALREELGAADCHLETTSPVRAAGASPSAGSAAVP